MSKSSPPEVRTLLTGLAMGESPRWHENRLWFSDWGAQEIVTVDLDGKREVPVRTPFGLPFCIDWLHDGRLLIVSGREGLSCVGSPTGRWRNTPIWAASQMGFGTKLSWTVVATLTSMAVPESSRW